MEEPHGRTDGRTGGRMDGPTDGRNFLDRERSERERERERPAPLLSSPLFSSRCHENGEERSGGTDGRGRRIGDHEQGEERKEEIERERERESPLASTVISSGAPRDQTCNLYIAPYLPTYLPVARTPRKYTAFFTTREREDREVEGPRGARGKGSGRFFPSPSAILPFSPA